MGDSILDGLTRVLSEHGLLDDCVKFLKKKKCIPKTRWFLKWNYLAVEEKQMSGIKMFAETLPDSCEAKSELLASF